MSLVPYVTRTTRRVAKPSTFKSIGTGLGLAGLGLAGLGAAGYANSAPTVPVTINSTNRAAEEARRLEAAKIAKMNELSNAIVIAHSKLEDQTYRDVLPELQKHIMAADSNALLFNKNFDNISLEDISVVFQKLQALKGDFKKLTTEEQSIVIMIETQALHRLTSKLKKVNYVPIEIVKSSDVQSVVDNYLGYLRSEQTYIPAFFKTNRSGGENPLTFARLFKEKAQAVELRGGSRHRKSRSRKNRRKTRKNRK